MTRAIELGNNSSAGVASTNGSAEGLAAEMDTELVDKYIALACS